MSERDDALEDAARVCDLVAANAERRAAGYENEEAKLAALDKMEAAQLCAHAIRELKSRGMHTNTRAHCGLGICNLPLRRLREAFSATNF